MKQVSGKRLAKLAQSNGWVLARIKGRHNVFTKDGRTGIFVIPFHRNSPLMIGLLRALMKIIPLSEKEL